MGHRRRLDAPGRGEVAHHQDRSGEPAGVAAGHRRAAVDAVAAGRAGEAHAPSEPPAALAGDPVAVARVPEDAITVRRGPNDARARVASRRRATNHAGAILRIALDAHTAGRGALYPGPVQGDALHAHVLGTNVARTGKRHIGRMALHARTAGVPAEANYAGVAAKKRAADDPDTWLNPATPAPRWLSPNTPARSRAK